MGRRNCNRKDLGLIDRQARQHESNEARPRHGAVGNHIVLDQQPFEFLCAPTASERSGVQPRKLFRVCRASGRYRGR